MSNIKLITPAALAVNTEPPVLKMGFAGISFNKSAQHMLALKKGDCFVFEQDGKALYLRFTGEADAFKIQTIPEKGGATVRVKGLLKYLDAEGPILYEVRSFAEGRHMLLPIAKQGKKSSFKPI